MTPLEYITACHRTLEQKQILLNDTITVDKSALLHASMGLVTEAGEFQDQLKKHLMYGKPLDVVNLKEELGDLLWYVSVACRVLDVTYEELFDSNISKLRTRYPEKFTDAKALTRDTEKERKTLEL